MASPDERAGAAAPNSHPDAPLVGPVALAVRRPVGVLVGVILVVLFGLLSLLGLPIQLTPDIEIPTLTVTTVWPGAAPAEVEREIIEEQEEVLKSLVGLERMLAESSPDQGQITLELAVGTNIDEALVRVTNLLSQVPRYPEAARQPVVSTGDSGGPPLAVVLVQNTSGHEVAGYRTWVQDEILPSFERIKGVARVDLFGGRDTEVVVRFEAEKLAARGVTVSQLAAALRTELRDISGGELNVGKRAYTVRTLAAPDDATQLEQLVILPATANRPAVLIGDVANVRQGLRIRRGFVIGNDRESLALLFRREVGSNVLEVTREIVAAVDQSQRDQMEPIGLSIKVVSDQVDYIEGALGLVQQNILIGGVLAACVLLVFLRSFSAAGVVTIAIPVCVIGTALGMSLLGRSVNVVSLAGMAFAVGMVVDNAIVVLENIDAWRSRVATVAEAAVRGTNEVFGALVASTLTTAAVFLPIIAWQDEVGELLRDVALAVSMAVFLSLVVSLLVIPSFSAKLLSTDANRASSLPERIGGYAREGIVAVVAWLVRARWRAALMTLIVPPVFGAITWLALPPLDYLPTGNRNQLFGVLVPPPGYSIDEMASVAEDFQARVDRHRGVEIEGYPALGRSFFGVRAGFTFMGATAERDDGIGGIVSLYRREQAKVPGMIGVASQASLFGRGLAASRAIDIDLLGSSLEELVRVGGAMMGELKGAMPGAQMRPIPSLDLGAPELQVLPRREDAARLGITGAELGLVVDALIDGAIVGEFGAKGGRKRDVVLRAPGDGPSTREALAASVVATPSGAIVPLSTLGDVVEGVGPSTIRRLERRRAITIQFSPPEGIALETAMALIEGEILPKMRAAGSLPQSVQVELTGTADKLTDARNKMGQVLLLAVLICFLLLAALYEDFLAPIAVLVTVPLAAAGGAVFLRAINVFLVPQPLDMMTAMGFVILIGVVVNNAILVVDGALQRMESGEVLADALAESVRRRLRPIAMSTLTSLAGLLPLVLFPGAGSELYRGVGAVVLGGLALSTVLTVFVVPCVMVTVWTVARRR